MKYFTAVKCLATGILYNTLLLLLFSTCCLANRFYVDPAVGDINNTGSTSDPWSTLEEVFDQGKIETQRYTNVPYDEESYLIAKNEGAPVQPGDTIVLRDGLHGAIFYRGAYNVDWITIMAEDGHTPILSRIQLSACEKWRLIGLTVNPEAYGIVTTSSKIFFESHGHHGPAKYGEIIDCYLTSGDNAEAWSAQDWKDRAGTGIHIKGSHFLVKGNICKNVAGGINATGDYIDVLGNQVINFSNDGLRVQGSHQRFEQNVVKNCYNVDINHDDGLQSFTNSSNPFTNVIIKNNLFINHENFDHPLAGTLQGIGCFDGPYIDWIIENNIVYCDHYHGITLSGAINCRIINNTVIDARPEVKPGNLWIRIGNHKDGWPSENCIIANNITTGLSVGTGVSAYNNVVINDSSEYKNHFANLASYEFDLKSESSAIDFAHSLYAPTDDFLGNFRMTLSSPDAGALEYIQSPSIDCNGYIQRKVYVSASGDSTANGQTWATASSNLLFAAAVAHHCSDVDSIFVSKGSFFPTPDTSRQRSIKFPKNVYVYGGFQGDEANLGDRLFNEHTILNGDIGMIGDDTDNSLHILHLNYDNDNVYLDGFKIIGGHNISSNGSAIYNEGQNIRLKNIILENNLGQAIEINGQADIIFESQAEIKH